MKLLICLFVLQVQVPGGCVLHDCGDLSGIRSHTHGEKQNKVVWDVWIFVSKYVQYELWYGAHLLLQKN